MGRLKKPFIHAGAAGWYRQRSLAGAPRCQQHEQVGDIDHGIAISPPGSYSTIEFPVMPSSIQVEFDLLNR